MKQLSRGLFVLAVVAAGVGVGSGPGWAASPTSVSGTPHPWTARTTGSTVPGLNLLPGQHDVAGTTVSSGNWSGYQLSVLGTGTTPTAPSTSYSSISAQWTVPTATQETSGAAEFGSDWIGIGGGNDNPNQPTGSPTLIQTGTEADVSATGVATYDAWYEIIPEPETVVSMPVAPGDIITASIAESSSTPGMWTIDLNDVTNGKSFTQSTTYPSTMDTAEWIEEATTSVGTGGETVSIPNLGTTEFAHASVNGTTPDLSNALDIQLNEGSGVVAEPSAPDASGADFNICTFQTSCPAPGAASTSSGAGGSGGPPDPACLPLFTAAPKGSSYPPDSGQDWPQLDVIQGDMHDSPNTLSAVLTVSDMQTGPTALVPGGTANEYYMEWTYNSTGYFLNAEVSATGNSFSYGTLTNVGGQNTLNTMGAATGAITTGSDGTITISVPLSKVGGPAVGQTLAAPSALVSVLAGAPSNPSGVSGGEVIKADTAGPGYDYTLGEVCSATGQPGSDGGSGPASGSVPEAPLAAGIPLVGLMAAGGLVYRRRRRWAPDGD